MKWKNLSPSTRKSKQLLLQASTSSIDNNKSLPEHGPGPPVQCSYY